MILFCVPKAAKEQERLRAEAAAKEQERLRAEAAAKEQERLQAEAAAKAAADAKAADVAIDFCSNF